MVAGSSEPRRIAIQASAPSMAGRGMSSDFAHGTLSPGFNHGTCEEATASPSRRTSDPFPRAAISWATAVTSRRTRVAMTWCAKK